MMDHFDVAVVVPLSILSTFVVVSNVLVCALVFSQRRMRTYTNGFVVSLALSDIMIGITMFIQYNAELHHVSRITVNIIYSFVFICGVANLCAVTYDRHLAVTQPFKYKAIIAKVAKICVPLLWVFSIFIGALPLFWGGQWGTIHHVYIIIYLIGFFLIPYVFILVANFRIFRLVRRCVQRERQLSISSSYNGKCDGTSSPRNMRRMASDAKIARVFALVAFMFLISWFPTIYYTSALALVRTASVPEVIIDISPFTVVLGSAVNPVLYSFMKPDFRKAIKKIVKRIKDRHNQGSYSLGPSSLGETSTPLQRDATATALVSTPPPATVRVVEIELSHPLIETVV